MTEAEVRLQDEKMQAEIGKLMAETSKVTDENRWYPFVIGSGMTLAIVAAVKLFLYSFRRPMFGE